MKKIRYGFIGAGQMACGHAGCIKEIPDIELVAAADPNAKSLNGFRHFLKDPEKSRELLQKYGHNEGYKKLVNQAPLPDDGTVKIFSDYHELLKLDEIDAVVVATPAHTHVDITADVLAAGKHVLSEKPAATSRAQLRKLEEAVNQSDRIYQVGLECRYLPVFQKMRKMVEDNAVGHPRMIWCLEFRGPFMEKTGNWIMFQDKTGGIFVEKTCHFFDLMTWFADSRPRKVIALASQDVIKEIYGVKPDIFDNGWVIVEYENKARAMLGLCMFSSHPLSIGIAGDGGKMEGFFGSQKINYKKHEGDRTEIDTKPDANISALSHNGGVYFEHLAFIDNISNNKKPLTDIETAKWSTLVGLAAEESAGNGGTAVTF